MAAANIENFSVCRFVISLFLLQQSLQGGLASVVPLRNVAERGRNGLGECENVQDVTENVRAREEGLATKAQRHKTNQEVNLSGICDFVPLHKKSCSSC